MDAIDPVVFPEDLGALSIEELTSLQARANTTFDVLAANETPSADDVAELERIAAGIEAITPLVNARRADAARGSVSAQRKTAAPVTPTPTTPEDTAMASTSSTDATSSVVAASLRKPSLATVRELAPQIGPNVTGNDLVITAAAPRYGLPTGSRFGDLDSLVSAFQNHAKAQVVTSGVPQFLTVASIANKFSHEIDGQGTSLRDFEYMANSLRSEVDQDALVAGGGWCSPSEIRYNFFNITCEDGMIDLPTFGVQRGGVQFPVSPSLADVFTGTFTNATNPWLWTEADDILTVTGTPDKPCVRVTCPTFTERRLECYGICLTAGNLTDAAYPEATRNHLSLLMSAHYHAMNQRYIQTMVSLSSAITSLAISGTGILADAPAAVGLAAQDYRTRYGMCDDDVLEVVFPRWVKDAMRVDHLRRTGFWEGAIADADINALFARFRVRVQWVSDWQVRASGLPGFSSNLTDWPGTVDFMIYAAGTFMLGNGMSLDLGVVRDSVLNASNDHTAAWTEECHLIAKYGHESRQYRIPVCVAGRTGAANITCSDV